MIKETIFYVHDLMAFLAIVVEKLKNPVLVLTEIVLLES